MQAIEKHLLGHCTQALMEIMASMKQTPASILTDDAPSRKDDSLKLDVLPESILRKKLIEDYDRHLVLVTEEKGEFNFPEINEAEIVAFADPTDRSKYLKQFIENTISKQEMHPDTTFGEILDSEGVIENWEEYTKMPAKISGACCSVTMAKRGEILFSAILNYITEEIVIACENFIGYSPIKDITMINGEYDYNQFKKISFKYKAENANSYVTYLGKDYQKFLDKSKLLGRGFHSVEKEPGGPARILYLSEIAEIENKIPAGFILSNGEKIVEWLGWLAFGRHCRDLVIYSTYPLSYFSKDDILMTPSPPYSILEYNNNKIYLNYSKLIYFQNPSRYREMILITHRDNTYIQAIIDANKSRRLL